MCIDKPGQGGGHNNACLTKPFPERRGGDEDARKSQREYESRREAEGSAALRFAFSLLPQSPDRKNSSIDDGGHASADQWYRESSKGCHASGSKNKCHLDDRRNR